MGNHNSDLQCAVKFYKDLTKAKTMLNVPTKNLRETIKLIIQIQNCTKGEEYQFKAYDCSVQPPKLLGTSEKAMADTFGMANFQTSFLMQYYFEKEQPILITINKYKGEVDVFQVDFKTSIGSVVGGRNNTLNKKLDENREEMISISATELKDNQEYLNIQFDVSANKPLKYKESKNYFTYLISNNTKLYQSETISERGTFNPAHIPIPLLAPSFEVAFFDCKKKQVHSIKCTLDEFIKPNGQYSTFTFPLSKNRSITITNKSAVRKSYSFIDYLKSGVQIGMTIAVDFTGSNGDPRDQGSLHYIAPGMPNDYERAIFSCGNIVAYYDYDQLFPVFGFGAELPGEQKASMCFNINMLDNPDIYTIQGVLAEYQKTVMNITFSGPTLFGPILRKTIEMIKAQNDKMKYSVLMILTDGMINDMTESINLLVEGAKLPLSVIIIGIGNANFGNMELLDADDNPLVSSTGERCCRDLVQFVPFNKFEHNAERLAAVVLEEIPTQIVQYYAMNNIYPQNQ